MRTFFRFLELCNILSVLTRVGEALVSKSCILYAFLIKHSGRGIFQRDDVRVYRTRYYYIEGLKEKT